MGDMADFYNEQIEDEEEARADFWSGRMTMIEAYDRGITDEFGFVTSASSKTVTKTCKCCGKTGLTWAQLDGKWRLHEGRELHNCPINPLRG
jgi:hypothetical protein